MAAPKTEILLEHVARHLWGEPNEQLSRAGELRFGTNGSKSVDLEKLQWYDHEAQVGGSTLQLVKHVEGCTDRKAQYDWLRRNGFFSGDAEKTSGVKVMQVMKSCREKDKTGEQVPEVPSPKPAAAKASKTPAKIVATYDYRDEQGELLMQVVRMEPKTFRQRRPEGNGWSWRVKDVRVVPYRLPELLASLDAVVHLTEGEKDADRLAEMGLVATTNAGGAGKWRKEHSEFLRGRSVVILPDNDQAGQLHAQKVAKTLRGIASDVRIVTLHGLPDKGDVSDWLDAGGTVEELALMRGSAAPTAQAGEEDDDGEGRKPSQTDLLVKFVKERFDLLHDKNGDTYARDRHTGEVRRMGARQFRDRVTAGFYEQTEVAVRDQAWREALGTLQALARFEGAPQDVHIRIAGSGSRYWIDLCQPGSSRAVEMDAAGWRIVDRAPVLFVRGEAAYSTRWRTRFHADGGQCSSVMADSVPR